MSDKLATERKWFIRAYIPVDPDDKTGMELEAAIEELKEVRQLQPENRYELVSADEDEIYLIGQPPQDPIYHERFFPPLGVASHQVTENITMTIIDDYFTLQKRIHKYFGYVEDWVVLPMEDSREFLWKLEREGPGVVRFALTKEVLDSAGEYYEDQIYTQQFLPRWVYRAKELTMVCVDTQTDGNRFLRIFDNQKEQL